MSNNFNSQKFTSLKKIKPAKSELASSEKKPFDENEVNEQGTPFYALDEKQEVTEELNLEDDISADALEKDKSNPLNIERSEKTKSNEKTPLTVTNNEDDEVATGKMLKASTILFWIGIAAAILQFLTLVAVLIIDAEAFLLFGWIPQMSFLLLFGSIMFVSLISAFVTALVYRKKAQKSKTELKRGKWYAIWITSITVGMIFFGNLVYTALLYINEFIF